jgi:hypothetical protein
MGEEIGDRPPVLVRRFGVKHDRQNFEKVIALH